MQTDPKIHLTVAQQQEVLECLQKAIEQLVKVNVILSKGVKHLADDERDRLDCGEWPLTCLADAEQVIMQISNQCDTEGTWVETT